VFYIDYIKFLQIGGNHPCPSKGGELRREQGNGNYVQAKFPSFGGAGVVIFV
jgi:hypothetical protein